MKKTIPALAMFFILLVTLAPLHKAHADKDPNVLKAGISYVWLSDYDSQGLMFYNKYNRYLGDRLSLGLNIGALNASRYDSRKEIYTIRNTFYMASLDLAYDLMQNDMLRARIGAGPGARHRAEINSNIDDGTLDGSVRHVRTSDVGFYGYLENDFNILRNGVSGFRIEYFHYTEGTPVLSIGFHLGFQF
ncbi:hypothetical protein [Pontibacter sp. HJ8]